ncbi:chloramphenicol resistance leader peptide [Corynebacterium marquesiae]
MSGVPGALAVVIRRTIS